MRVRGLRHRYQAPGGVLTVLDGIDLDVPAGGYLAVTGRSGAGKSTLLAIVGGLEKPQEGTVEVGDIDLTRANRNDLAHFRGSTVGFVFQHFGLLDQLTAAENVELAGSLAGLGGRRRRARARDLLGAVGLAHRADHRPTQLSGGERQRVAIARAMTNEPRLLLADEPTGNLDGESAAAVVALLEDVHRDRGCTLVVVTHDRTLAARAHRHLDLSPGRDPEPGSAPGAAPAPAPVPDHRYAPDRGRPA